MSDAPKLRPYGPGKFDTILDSYVYSVSLDGGGDDEVGDSSVDAHYTLMRHGYTIFRDHDPFLESLTEAEADYLKSVKGCIVREDSYGFVHVDYFDDMATLDSTWAAIQDQYDGADEDSDEDCDEE